MGWDTKDLVARSKALGRDCFSALSGLTVSGDDVRQLVVSTLYARILELYHGVPFLLDVGLLPPAQVVTRALMEALFTVRAIADDEEVLKRYVGADQYRKLKLIGKSEGSERKPLSELGDERLEEIVAEIQQSISEHEIKPPLSAEALAHKAKLHDWYLIEYSLLSTAVHTSINELEEYLDMDENDELQGFLFTAFRERDAAATVALSSLSLLKAHETLADVFDLDPLPVDKAHGEFFRELMKQLQEGEEDEGT